MRAVLCDPRCQTEQSVESVKINANCHLLTCDGNIWPGLLFPPGGNKHGDVGVASVQEEVHGELDS